MAEKKYTVAPGNSFTADGFIYLGGDEIPAAVFADKTVLAALVSKGRIIESGEDKMKIPETKKPDVVLLSPACASFDMYDNFEQRGEHFKNYVKSKKV